jgi:hypothetical protein
MSKLDQIRALGQRKFGGAGGAHETPAASIKEQRVRNPKEGKLGVSQMAPSTKAADTADGQVSSVKPPPKPKRGRPRIGEKREQPWLALGMSRTTYWRRQQEKKS